MSDISQIMASWIITLPAAVVLVGAVVGVLFEAFIQFRTRRIIQIGWTGFVTVAAAGTIVWRMLTITGTGWFGGPKLEARLTNSLFEYHETPVVLALQLMLVIAALLSLLVMVDRTSENDGSFASETASEPGSSEEALADRKGRFRSEIFPLMLFSLGGMMIFPATTSLLTMFIALEVMSLPLYILAATARRRRLLSQEAALKYFILGAFSSAFFLMGSALYYGYTHTVNLMILRLWLDEANHTGTQGYLMVAGLVMILIGLLFKVGAVPFHAWTPDVYTGAPTPVTGFMAAAVKLAAFGAIINLVFVPDSVDNSFNIVTFTNSLHTHITTPVRYFLYVVIILTIVLGTVVGMVQTNVKRMIAYSSIAHAGFILMAFFHKSYDHATHAVLFYLGGYALATIGAFALVALVRRVDQQGNILGEAHDLESWKGLGRNHPWIAGAMLLFLMSFAGIPMTAGFMGKFLVFSAAVQAGQIALVVIAILASVATAFFYFRLTVYMFFEPTDTDTVAVRSDGGIFTAVILCGVGTVVLGVLPGLLLGMLG